MWFSVFVSRRIVLTEVALDQIEIWKWDETKKGLPPQIPWSTSNFAKLDFIFKAEKGWGILLPQGLATHWWRPVNFQCLCADKGHGSSAWPGNFLHANRSGICGFSLWFDWQVVTPALTNGRWMPSFDPHRTLDSLWFWTFDERQDCRHLFAVTVASVLAWKLAGFFRSRGLKAGAALWSHLYVAADPLQLRPHSTTACNRHW